MHNFLVIVHVWRQCQAQRLHSFQYNDLALRRSLPIIYVLSSSGSKMKYMGTQSTFLFHTYWRKLKHLEKLGQWAAKYIIFLFSLCTSCLIEEMTPPAVYCQTSIIYLYFGHSFSTHLFSPFLRFFWQTNKSRIIWTTPYFNIVYLTSICLLPTDLNHIRAATSVLSACLFWIKPTAFLFF